MKVYSSINSIPPTQDSIALSLGSYDGLHKGHQYILETLKETAKRNGYKSCVLTFSNHPTWVLENTSPKPLLNTIEHKEQLFKKIGIDILLHIPFTPELAGLSPNAFFDLLTEKLPIKSCTFGKDTCIGKNRAGSQGEIERIGQKRGIAITCLDRIGNYSSSLVRKALSKGNLDEVEKLLGRPFSIYAPTASGKGVGKKLGYPTINLPLENTCYPPLGVYITECIVGNSHYPSISNLGFAPTLGASDKIHLETHLLNEEISSPPEFIEVKLLKFLREEKHFENTEALKKQIEQDTKEALGFFSLN